LEGQYSCLVIHYYWAYIPNKQKPLKNTRFFGVFHISDPSISRDNSRVVEVNVDNLITGLGPSFYMAKTWVYFTIWTLDFYMRKIFFSHLLKLIFFKMGDRGGYIIDFWYTNILKIYCVNVYNYYKMFIN